MAWPRRSGPYPDVKGKDVTPTDLLNAARTMVTQSRPGTAGLWPRAAALLGRQALEAALDELWSRTHPGLERASMRCQLLCLPIVLTDRELAGRAAHDGDATIAVPPNSHRPTFRCAWWRAIPGYVPNPWRGSWSAVRSTTRWALPTSVRGRVPGGRTWTSGRSASRRSSATAIEARVRWRWSSPPTSPANSHTTMRLGMVSVRSTTRRYCGPRAGSASRTASTSLGYTLTPRMTSMSSARPTIFDMRIRVRPHTHGPGSIAAMSPVR